MARSEKGRRPKGRMREDGGRRANWVEKVGLLAAVASAVVAIVALADRSDSPAKDPPAELSLVALAVREVRRGPKPHSSLEIIVHNSGGRLAVIDEARIDVRHAYELPRCASQDDLPLSQTYGVAFPVDSKPGAVLTPSLHQQVGADEADRFEIALGAKWPDGRSTSTVHLFEVRVSLRTDAPQRDLLVGNALVSLPTYPYPGEYYWTTETPKIIHNLITASPAYAAQLRRYSMPCWQANTMTLRQALSSRVVRSSDLAEIQRSIVSPAFAVLE